MDKQAALAEMESLLKGYEDAIHQHPAETVAAYEMGRKGFEEGHRKEVEAGATAPAGLTLDEFLLVERYTLGAAFIAAWYHLAGDQAKRDTMAHSTASIVSAVGLDAEDAFRRFLHLEQNWRRTLKASGAKQSGGNSGALLWIIIIALIVAAVYLL